MICTNSETIRIRGVLFWRAADPFNETAMRFRYSRQHKIFDFRFAGGEGTAILRDVRRSSLKAASAYQAAARKKA